MAENTAAAVNAELDKKGLPTDDQLDDAEEGEKIEVEEEAPEEVEIEAEDEGEDTSSTEDEDGPSEEEHIAQQSGWRPKDEWDGDPDEWIPAREFNRRGELLRKIHNQNRQIKQLDGVVTNLAKQQKKIFDAGYEKAKRELKSRLRAATQEGDDSLAEAIEERLESLEEQKVEDTQGLEAPEQKKTQPEVAPEFVPWVNRNQWFVKYPEMRAYAEQIGMQYAANNPAATNSTVYDYITKTVKSKFPERFGMPTKKTVKPGSPVEGSEGVNSGRGRAGETSMTRVALTSEEKDVGRTLVKRGLYKNMNEYAADLKKYGVKGK